ncbi:MAG: helix-turn-helix domain-containing protein [Acidimicrobiales bacterium]
MEHMGRVVRRWLEDSGLRAASVARRAGVSASTLHRVLHDSVDPSVGTLEEIALACGFSLELATTQASDRFASAAARSLLEDGYCPPDDPAVVAWEQRLHRWAGDDDPIGLVQAAAAAASPLHREDAVLFAGEETLARIASAGDASNGRWALSGPAGLDPSAPPVSLAPPVTILWCDDPRQASLMLTESALTSTRQVHRVSVAVVGAEPELFFDAFSVGIVRFVSPIQIVIDCLTQGGAAAKAALNEASSW